MILPGQLLLGASQRVHFIGIGGIGMSGIAEILLTMGYSVSGSDMRRSAATERLSALGAVVFEGHVRSNAAACDVVVASSAVAEMNEEVQEARARKIPVIQRAEMLAELMRMKYGIAVAGMHGKTTTTSMIAAVIGSLDPTVVVGGRVDAMDSNARLGTGPYLVAEADESDRSFLKLSPILAVVTNLDREHMDCYSSDEDVDGAFVEFMDRLPFYGAATCCVDDARLQAILGRVRRRVFTYGQDAAADFRVVPLGASEGVRATFGVEHRGVMLGPFRLYVPGWHNVLNATAAVAVGAQLGLSSGAIARGLASFRGVDRRFEVKGSVGGVTVVDDYGHHPTEIVATLKAARECGYKGVHVLFQPHRYTRTRDQMEAFATAFEHADSVEVLDIYAAGEEPIAGVSGEALARRIVGGRYARSVEEAVAAVAERAKAGELVLTQGAGNVSAIAPVLLTALRTRFGDGL